MGNIYSFLRLATPCLVLDAVSGRDDVPPVDEDPAALALADPDERLPRKRAEAGRLPVQHAAVGAHRQAGGALCRGGGRTPALKEEGGGGYL